MNAAVFAAFAEAVEAQPAWLQAWARAFLAAHMLGLAFVAHRSPEGWKVRTEPIAIAASFVASGIFMVWLFGQVGYVRLLGLAHLVFWTPVYVWILRRRRAIGVDSLFGKYVLLYLVIVGICLVIDAVDVVRYLVGDR